MFSMDNLSVPDEIVLDSASHDAPRSLADWVGRVVVLFYESREHLDDNARLKAEIRRMAAEHPDLAVLAVGDVAAFDFAPVRSIVRSASRAIADRHSLELLLDWRARLTAAPFGFARDQANVAILDRDGRIVLRATGALRPGQEERFLVRLRSVLGDYATMPLAEVA